MEEKTFSKQQVKQLQSVIGAAIADSEERLKDFTRSTIRAEIRASESRTAETIRASEKRIQQELHSVVEDNIFPVLEQHERRLTRLEQRPV